MSLSIATSLVFTIFLSFPYEKNNEMVCTDHACIFVHDEGGKFGKDIIEQRVGPNLA